MAEKGDGRDRNSSIRRCTIGTVVEIRAGSSTILVIHAPSGTFLWARMLGAHVDRYSPRTLLKDGPV